MESLISSQAESRVHLLEKDFFSQIYWEPLPEPHVRNLFIRSSAFGPKALESKFIHFSALRRNKFINIASELVNRNRECKESTAGKVLRLK